MTNIEKNIAIAEMLGWKDKDGDFLLPKSLETNYDYREWCGTKNAHIQESWMVTPEQQYNIASGNLMFHLDANWQFEAIQFIENEGYAFEICQENVIIYEHASYSFLNTIIEVTKETKKEAIFEALFQFNQYLNKKLCFL